MMRRAWPVPVCALVVAAIVYAVWPLTPKRYESQTTIIVVPQRVPEDVVRPVLMSSTARMMDIRLQVLSRTRLEQLVRDFRLYEALQTRLPMEDIVERMRQDVQVRVASSNHAGDGPLMQFSFVSSDPKVSQRVVDRLSSLFVNESLQDREVVAETTYAFLTSQVDDTRERLLANAKAIVAARTARKDDEARVLGLESEVLEGAYKSLLAKRAEALVRMALERRQIGEQFRVLDRARIPEHPLGPTRMEATGVGGAIGAVVGLLLTAWLTSKRA